MRFYDITISVPATAPANQNPGTVIVPPPFQGLYDDTSYTSNPKGKFNPNALDIELQIRNYAFSQPGTPASGSFVRIWGVSQDEINQSTDLNGREIIVKAGMTDGLPLAKPEQAGVLVAGRIYQAFGNWKGVDKTLDLLLYGPPVSNRNFQFLWKKGQRLESAIKATLATAMPDYQPVIAISNDLVSQYDQPHSCTKFVEFRDAIRDMTNKPPYSSNIKTLDGSTYAGVTLLVQDNPGQGGSPGVAGATRSVTQNKGVLVYDKSKSYQNLNTVSNPKSLQYEDFVGQPTWIGPQVIQFDTVMRADIKVGDYVRIPEVASLFAIVTNKSATIGLGVPSRDKMAFSQYSAFHIQTVNHWGRYREPSASAWISTFTAQFSKITMLGGSAAP